MELNQEPNQEPSIPASVPEAIPEAVTEPAPLAEPTKSNPTLIIGIVVGLMVLVGGTAYAYTSGLFGSLGLGGAPYSSENVLRAAAHLFGDIERGRAELALSVVTEAKDADVYPFPSELSADNETMELGLDVWSGAAQMIPSDFSAALAVAATFDFSEEGTAGGEAQVKFDLDLDDFVINADVELMSDNLETYYVKVNRLPSLVLDLGSAKGKWIVITAELLESLGMPSLADLDVELTAEEQAEIDRSFDFMKDLFVLVEKYDVLESASPVSEEVNEETLYRYQMSMNGGQAEAFYREAADVYRDFLLETTSGDEFAREIGVGMVEEFFSEENIQLYSSQAYIDFYNVHAPWSLWMTSGGELRQVGFESRLAFDEKDAPNFAGKQIKLGVILRLEDINKPVNFTAPADAVSLESLSEEVPVIKDFLDGIEASLKFEVTYPVDDITYALDTYNFEQERYPETLDELATFMSVYDEGLYGYSYDYDYDPEDTILYAVVNSGGGYLVCNRYAGVDTYYCATDKGSGDVTLSEVGDAGSSLADMYQTISEGLLTGSLLSSEQRDENRKAVLMSVDDGYSWATYEFDNYSSAWESYKKTESLPGGQLATLPQYFEYQFTETVDLFGDPDYELCTRLENVEAYWCVSADNYEGYEVEVAKVE